MINGNTALLRTGNFDTGKRTDLKRAVSECVYTGRLYYNKETHIAAFNEKIEYTEYHINFDDTSKYYTLV